MEMTLNMGAFEALDQQELFAVDGGWTAEQWIVGACTVVGAAVGFAIGGPIGAAVGAKCGAYGAFATAVVTIAIDVGCGYVGNRVANAIING